MKQNNMLAMILAGGRGSRLHELTNKVAKPAVSYGGKYRIIDFPLSNCINSGVDTVGVLTVYRCCCLDTAAECDHTFRFSKGDRLDDVVTALTAVRHNVKAQLFINICRKNSAL